MAPQAPEPDPARHGPAEASEWVARFARLVQAGGPVLDLAAGSGRHTRFFLQRGHPVLAVDRDIAALESIASPRLELLRADLEEGPWPLEGRRFAGVIVANYLHRPLLPAVIAAVADGGALIYETFAAGNEAYGRPRNPDFLLRAGELLEAVRGALEVVAYEHGPVERPRPAVIQRIAAWRSGPPSTTRSRPR